MELKLQNISKSYGKNKALSDFSMTFTPGIYALLGPNGSGKSTLMNIITDNLRADTGEILYNGEPVRKLGVHFREKIGFMPQYPGFYTNFSARDFLCYIACLKDIPRKEIRAAVEDVLCAVELSDVAGQRIGTFSGGMKQRLALAQATLGDPEIIILDEPTAGLDPKQRIAVRNYISSIALKKIVMIATHVVSDVEFIAKEVIMLKKGVITDQAPPCELIANMAGKVWGLRCKESEIPFYEQRFQVVGISKAGEDTVELRVISDTGEGMTALSPTLEDYYLYVFGGQCQPAGSALR
ncbi:MAG: ATP-binding cassette domain-containing protein [Clostridia bacterium]|nr:ATP-binding cassette domain-containing protein [Clostridia bacterium]